MQLHFTPKPGVESQGHDWVKERVVARVKTLIKEDTTGVLTARMGTLSYPYMQLFVIKVRSNAARDLILTAFKDDALLIAEVGYTIQR